ncbi:MAG: class II aldolase/adducin family protein [Planctomycetota bacterium]|jgi:rhamnose utilization protein RhaD (predicted bifunctional aldolase and dehydrogenase)
MDESLLQLIRISNVVGNDRSLIHGSGGNTSVKTADGNYMYIKASGTQLKNMSAQVGWRRLRVADVVSIMQDESTANLETYAREAEVTRRLLAACDDDFGSEARPSVEAILHAFSGRFVVHLHPAAVLAYGCAKNGRAELQELFEDKDAAVLWVPYADPGFSLAKRVLKFSGEYKEQFGAKPAICFLEKHGLVVSAEGEDEVLELVKSVVNSCNARLMQPKAQKGEPPGRAAVESAKTCIRRGFFEGTGEEVELSYFYSDTIGGFWRLAEVRQMLGPPAVTPEELLYANGPAMWIGKCDQAEIAGKLAGQLADGRKASLAFLVKGVGLIVVGKGEGADTVRGIIESSLLIRANALKMGGIVSLSGREQDFVYRLEGNVS